TSTSVLPTPIGPAIGGAAQELVDQFQTETVVDTVAPGVSGVSEKSSTPRPSSAVPGPPRSKSGQRIRNVAPGAMLTGVIVKLRAVRFAARFPFSAPEAPVVIGLLKSSELTSVQVPVVRLVAFVLYWKSRRSAATVPVAPFRDCSPV